MAVTAAAPTLLSFTKKDGIEEIQKASLKLKNDNPIDNAADEDFWYTVQQAYHLSPDYVNPDNGFYCPTPHIVTEALCERIKEVNSQTSYYMRCRDDAEQLEIRKKIAEFSGVPVEELSTGCL